ncbi:epoxide hydrolase [Alcaligenaceae bacterium C4P045]|nr:epoxide hydrolase [Alcaligenaceae bacterium C4P045]
MTSAFHPPQPFTLRIPDDALADLGVRLGLTRFPDQPDLPAWTTGTDLAWMRELVAYWHKQFDWRAQEARLNAFDNYTVDIGAHTLHFLHVAGRGPAPLPLVLSHGWPGSVFEFLQLIPRLTDPARFGGDPADAFTIVAPSLPGYGLSFKAGAPRVPIEGMADLFATLMTDVLGYARFGAQGGDWGASVSARLGHAYPDRVAGIHLNMLPLPRDPHAFDAPSAEERAYLDAVQTWLKQETGYSTIQGTRPQTLAYALTDSPAGLAAWIAEKFRAWSDCGGDVDACFSKDELLSHIGLYWFTGSINASFWPYYARHQGSWPFPPAGGVTVPTGYAAFPAEIVRPPRSLAARTFTNIQRWTDMPHGGHFAALEQPDALAHEIRAFFRPLRM